MGMAMVMRITMMVITTIISTKVKPNWRLRRPWARATFSVIRVRPAIAIFLRSLAVHVKHILAAKTLRSGVVLVATQAPFGAVRERVQWNAAQELELLAIRTVQLHALHEDFQTFGKPVGAHFHLAQVGRVAHVLVFV